jgi:hypothetical protein
MMAVKITMYLIEDDRWQRCSLHLEVLKYLREENVAGAIAYQAAAGYMGRMRVKTSTLVEGGGKRPVIVSFVDTDENVQRVLPKLKEMAGHRLIIRENVVIEHGSLE